MVEKTQIDFRLTEVVKDSQAVNVHCLILYMPYSNRTATVALAVENQECLPTGSKRLFEDIGGMSQQLRIASILAAFAKVRKTKKEAIYVETF